MATQTFTVPGRFPSLNEFYRMPPMKQNRVKQECDEAVAWAAKGARIHRMDHRRDLDNVCFGKKFVCDGLVKAGVLIDDKPRYVVGFVDEFAYDEENPRIVVTLETA